MGYPMTFRRFVNRNRLQDGGYDKAPSGLWNYCQQRGFGGGWSDRERDLLDQANREHRELNGLVCMLAGDLRRLETDAVDENGICKYIAGRTSIPEETVAAVPKEFMAW